MGVLLTSVVTLLFCASSAHAASITYEQPFAFERHVEFNGNEEPWLGSLGQAWLVSGGSGTVQLELEFTASLTSDVDFIGGVFVLGPDGSALGVGSYVWFIESPEGDWWWPLVTHADTRVFYDVTQPAMFDVAMAGVARVTYLLDEPSATAEVAEVPETGTLLMTAFGLSLLWRLR